MINASRTAGVGLILVALAGAHLAQRPRTTGNTSTTDPPRTVAPAPQSVSAKYEGGVFGQTKKMDGTLSFDDVNSRLVFRDKNQREVISIPFASIKGAYADTHSVRPAAATAASYIPYAFPAAFVRHKVRYLTLEYVDPDNKVSGLTSFKLENREVLESTLNTLAAKSGLTARGQIFVRKAPDAAASPAPTP